MRRSVCVALALAAAVLTGGAGAAPRAQAAAVPAHVLTWYYYGLNDKNAAVPAAVMARYADFVEDDVLNDSAHVLGFKRAGGTFAVSYTDPAYAPYCHPPFTAPAGHCEGPVGRLLDGEERAFFHGRDGTRVRRFVDDHFLYQEAMNPKSPAARLAWRQTGEQILRNAPVVDYFMADDAGGPLHARDMSPKSGHFYNFNDAGTEITADAEFRDAWIAYITSAPRPLIVNGYDPGTGRPSYDGAILRARGVFGELHEDCFRTPGGLQTDAEDRWRFEADSLLANTALQRYAVCFMTGKPTPAGRMYALASWWLAYDPRWSVAAPIDPLPSQSAILPEFDIVPRTPLRTASAGVGSLRDPGGAFSREFGECYDAGAPIGACAAIVNPTSRPVTLPRLDRHYGHALVLDAGDAPSGGRARFAAAVPAALAPQSAVVLGR